MNKLIIAAFSLSISSQVVHAAPRKNKDLEGIKAYFQKRAAAESVWKNLLHDFEKGKKVSDYKGKEVLFDGIMWSRDNPIQVKVSNTKVVCLVFLQAKEVKSAAQYPADTCDVEVRGIIRSIDVQKKQIEVSSIETTVTAAD